MKHTSSEDTKDTRILTVYATNSYRSFACRQFTVLLKIMLGVPLSNGNKKIIVEVLRCCDLGNGIEQFNKR
jgi:hypothetical protein